MEENDLNLSRKYVCDAYDPHNCFHINDINRLRFFLFTKLSEKVDLQSFPQQERLFQLHILCSTYAAGWIWGVRLQQSDQIPSSGDLGWKYTKTNRFVVEWRETYDDNLNEYIFTCTCKGFSSRYSWIVYLSICRGVFKTLANFYDGAFL